jgi:phosphonate transport system substrate-binding protein
LKRISRLTCDLALVLLFLVTGCSDRQHEAYEPVVLRIGVLPDQGEAILRERFRPLAEHLSQALQKPFELVVPVDYADLVDQFDKGQLDLAYFGGLTFLQAHARAGAVPLVMRDVDAHFTSYFLMTAALPEVDWQGMRGLSFSFGSRLSTSGHLMPRYFLQQHGIEPESYFSDVRYSGAHDATAGLVEKGEVALGAANSQIINKMFATGRLSGQKVRILWETPPYADYVWAVRPDADQAFAQRLLNGFLSLSPINERHAQILEPLDAGGFVPASLEDFTALKEIAISAGMVEGKD